MMLFFFLLFYLVKLKLGHLFDNSTTILNFFKNESIFFLLNSDSTYCMVEEKNAHKVSTAQMSLFAHWHVSCPAIWSSLSTSKLPLYIKGPSFSTVSKRSVWFHSPAACDLGLQPSKILHPEAAFWALWLQRRKWNEIAQVYTHALQQGKVACSCIKSWFTGKNASVYPLEQHATIGCESSN